MDSIWVGRVKQEKLSFVVKDILIDQNRDMGVLNQNGYGAIVGRIKDMIIRGGENVYPREIEEILHSHPGIQEAHV